MEFFRLFTLVLGHRPGTALKALWYRAIGKKVRANNFLRIGAATAPYAYTFWVKDCERQDGLVENAPAEIASLPARPSFAILIHANPALPPATLAAMIESAHRQCYPAAQIIVVPSASGAPVDAAPSGDLRIATGQTDNAAQALSLALAMVDTDHVLPLPPGAILPPTALLLHARALVAHPGAAITYGDHDRIDPRGRRTDAWFKPQWNADMLLAQDYVSQACTIRSDLARAVGPIEPDLAGCAPYALALRASALAGDGLTGDGIVHVPHILCHLPTAAQDASAALRMEAVQRFVGQDGGTARPAPFDTVRVDRPLPEPPPLVSIIIPTRDKRELLEPCIETILRLTTYPNYEILVVDNASSDADTLAYLAEIAGHPAIRILPYPHAYNYSTINNFAVEHAVGAFICLLNNDTEVIAGEWLSAMMRQAVRPEVGAVGAKLLYDDGTIQHAGVAIGLGQAAGHAHRFLPDSEPGYFLQAHIQRFATAVTAACLVVGTDKFRAVGGLDAENLGIAYNDVDLCLKLDRAGWRNVYEPAAVLYHHESKSRGNDFSPEHLARYMRELHVLQERWGTRTAIDPLFHPALDRGNETYSLQL